jgi:hypothetical protein
VTAAVRGIAAVVALAVVGVVTAAGCTSFSGPTTPMSLENFTDVPVAIHADGHWIGTYEAGANRSVPVPGEPPVGIELFSPSGAQLVEWSFDAVQAVEGGVSTTELPCGVIRLSVGRIELPAISPPPPSGPCP